MKNIIYRIKHLFGYHRYTYKFRIHDATDLIECKICKKKFVINTRNQIILDWDLELHDMYRSFGWIE